MEYRIQDVADLLEKSYSAIYYAVQRHGLGTQRFREWILSDEDVAYIRDRAGKYGPRRKTLDRGEK